MGNKTVLVGLTVIRDGWAKKLAEINECNIKEIALFPTTLKQEERKKLYKALDESCVCSIPHVHLRHDMELWELEYFITKYKTKVFNLHAKYAYPDEFLKYASKIFVENLLDTPSEDELIRYGGVCVDFSHWEGNVQLNNDKYDEKMLAVVDKFKIGCCHVSAIKSTMHLDPAVPGRMHYDGHFFEKLSEFDYMEKYIKYLPEYVSLELENPIVEQLKAKKYLEKIINI